MLFRTVVWYLYFVFYLIYLIPRLIKVLILAKRGNIIERDSIVYHTAVKWAKSLIKLTGSSVDVTGAEHVPVEGSVVFVSNHQGYFDIPLLIGYIEKPKAFIAKKETAAIPLISTWMTHMKCVFLDRSDIRQSLKTINIAAGYLREGYSMVIFPEGTRSKKDIMNEFKAGSMKLAINTEKPIIPVTIKNSYKILEQNNFFIKPAKLEIIISAPIPTKGLSKEEKAKLPGEVEEIIEKNLIS